jgi:MFS family permease
VTTTALPSARRVQFTYLLLTLLSTLAASFIWGINTLFLLDAGLSNTAAFAANAFFAVGQLVFEVPTGVVADVWGRRVSFLLGCATLLVSTLLYLYMWDVQAGMWGWALASILLGLGFTFFSGAVEAWLVDALSATGFTGRLESVFGRAQAVAGAATLIGSVAGGFIAQETNLGVPYTLRAVVLAITLVVAFFLMRDLGFTPQRGERISDEVRRVVRASVDNGLRNPPVRWLMLTSPFSFGVAFYAFYAFQPYLLELYGDQDAFGIAGIAAAAFAVAQIVGGLAAPWVRGLFGRRSTGLIVSSVVGVASLAVVGLTTNFWVAVTTLLVWSLVVAATVPLRRTFLNGMIPSSERATVLSFDALLGSGGSAVLQPILGRVADVSGYAASYLVSAVVAAAELPFLWLARRERDPADSIETGVAD